MPSVWITVEIPTDVLDDIFTSAFDEGYSWFRGHEITAEGYTVIHDSKGMGNVEDCEELYMTKQQFAHSIGKWLEWQFDFEDYSSAIDSLDCDAAVQKAIFGEVIYG